MLTLEPLLNVAIAVARADEQVDRAWPWPYRVACWLGAFAVFPSLGITPKLLWVLVPFAMIAQGEQRLCTKLCPSLMILIAQGGQRLRTILRTILRPSLIIPAYSLFSAATWLWLCWANRPLSPGLAHDAARTGVVYTERPLDSSIVAWVCLPDAVVLLTTYWHVQLVCLLYRFDNQPSAEDVDDEQGPIVTTLLTPSVDLPKATVPSASVVIRKRLHALRATAFHQGSYFRLAVLLGVGWQVLEPAARYLLYVCGHHFRWSFCGHRY